jgi:tetratricopeptide (TPR) repeat protein
MTADRWERIKQIVGDALEIERDRRTAFIQRECAGDADLRGDVETLLRADEPGSTFLELDRAPERLGPWRVVREIGRGGMGTVYLAERDDGQFEQRAAIKVIKRGMDTEAVLRRFYAERQILARLQHPNITRLLDGGMFDHRPYFVMEYLEGEPLAEYCARTNATLEQRIALFLKVCDAVEYAHRNLVLHRDLKPGNILVDATGVPKLLDFGIAKLLEPDGSTEQTLLALTPQAASPEQVRGEALTTASDVYALGVLLFELLAGRPPYVIPPHAPVELARIVCDEPAPKVSTLADSAAARQLQGDLDNILLKAMEKEPAQRYQRAADLAADLVRYLQKLPVQARPAGSAYRLRKFIMRNQRPLAVAGLVLMAITAAVTDAVLQGRRAQRRFDDLRQLAGSFLFEFHDAIANLQGATPARELVLKRALQYLDSLSREAAHDTDLKMEVAEGYLRVGSAQGLYFESNLGKVEEARAAFTKSIALFEELRAARPNDIQVVTGLGRAMLSLNTLNRRDVAGALAVNRRVAAMFEEFGRRKPLDARAQLVLGQAYFGIAERLMDQERNEESIQQRMKSIEVLRTMVKQHPDDAEGQRFLAQSEKRLAYLYITKLRDFPKAGEHLRVSMKIDQERVAHNPSDANAKLDLALDNAYLAGLMRRRGDLEMALAFQQASAAARAEVLAADPRNMRTRYLLITDQARLGGLLRDLRRPAEARATFERGYQLAREGDAAAMTATEGVNALEDLRREAAAPAKFMDERLQPRR